MNIKNFVRKNPPLYRFLMRYVEKIYKSKYNSAKQSKDKLIRLISSDYQKKTGHQLRVPPVSYTEKIQFAKIFESTEEKGRLSDKYEVRRWVSDLIGDQYLIPLLGVWDHFDDIDFDTLPDQFVLKTNHGSGTNVIVTDKTKINKSELKNKFEFWLSEDFAFAGKAYELHYTFIKPKIIAEKYVVDSHGELNDYKFLCFNSEPKFVWVDVGRRGDHRRNIYDLNWNLQPFRQWTYKNTDTDLEKPDGLSEMIDIAKKLCVGFDHVRVDLYNVDGKIYFGEMTFTNGQGYENIYPPEYDDILGGYWNQEIDYSKGAII